MIKVKDLLNRFVNVNLMDMVELEIDIIDKATDEKDGTIAKLYTCYDLMISSIGDLEVNIFSFR